MQLTFYPNAGYNHILYIYILELLTAGADPGFQVRRGAPKKLRRAEGGTKNFGAFRVKNHDFTPKRIIFFPILGGHAPGAPPGSAPEVMGQS